jgi:hypothetical protein
MAPPLGPPRLGKRLPSPVREQVTIDCQRDRGRAAAKPPRDREHVEAGSVQGPKRAQIVYPARFAAAVSVYRNLGAVPSLDHNISN